MIFHLAAAIIASSDDEYYRINLDGTKNLIDTCLETETSLQRFIFASSIAAAGPTENGETFSERKRCNPISTYGKSKLLAEKYIEAHKKEIPFTIIRFPVMYGPRELGPIHAYFKVIQKGIKPVMGTGISCLCYVQDAVDGMIFASQKKEAVNQTYIIAYNELYSNQDIATYIEKALEKKALRFKIPLPLLFISLPFFWLLSKLTGKPPLFNRRNYNDLKYNSWRYIPEKISRQLGFHPQVDCKKGMKMTADWYKDNNYL